MRGYQKSILAVFLAILVLFIVIGSIILAGMFVNDNVNWEKNKNNLINTNDNSSEHMIFRTTKNSDDENENNLDLKIYPKEIDL